MSLGPEWAYRITITEPNWQMAQAWCELNIGKFDEEWYKLGIDIADNFLSGQVRSTWYFKREQDAVLFSLRWSS
jgi:hypothetical protein